MRIHSTSVATISGSGQGILLKGLNETLQRYSKQQKSPESVLCMTCEENTSKVVSRSQPLPFLTSVALYEKSNPEAGLYHWSHLMVDLYCSCLI